MVIEARKAIGIVIEVGEGVLDGMEYTRHCLGKELQTKRRKLAVALNPFFRRIERSYAPCQS